jgi:hypothetical protein
VFLLSLWVRFLISDRKIPALPEKYLDIHTAFAANYDQPVVYQVDSHHDGKPEAGVPALATPLLLNGYATCAG